MTQDDLFRTLLRTTRSAYSENAKMMAFAEFPNHVERQVVTPYHCKCSDVFQSDPKLASTNFSALQSAILAASNAAHWRETYKDTDIGADFMDRFGCYCIIGENAPFSSALIRLYMVYMPSHLYYPWHHHPAEEMYMVIAGRAVFRRKGCIDEVLGEGQTSFHESNQPHAMETTDDPVLCLVVWRDDFGTPPVLT